MLVPKVPGLDNLMLTANYIRRIFTDYIMGTMRLISKF